MLSQDIEAMQGIGLSKAQAVIYLILLELGQSKVGRVIEKTKLQSSVVHNNINKLTGMGLITFVEEGKIRHYRAADPEAILAMVEAQKKAIAEILPRLKAAKESKSGTEVEVFKGRRGFEMAFMEEYNILKPKETVSFIAFPEYYYESEELKDIFIKLNDTAIKKRAKFRGIGHKNIRKIWEKRYTGKAYDLRYSEENFPWDATIFRDTVLISVWGDEPMTIRIKDKVFHDSAYKYFEDKWKTAKK